MPILLILLNTMSFFCSPSSNDIIVQIEEHDFLAPEEYRFGTHSFGLIYRGDLEGILIYSMAATNQSILWESIHLEKEIYLDVKVGSRNTEDYRRVAQAVLFELLERFNLEIKLDEQKKIKTLKIIAINQDPLTALNIEKYKNRPNSGGISNLGEEYVIVRNSGCYHVSHFLTKRKILLHVEDNTQLGRDISFLFPQTLHKKLPKGKRQLIKWMGKYGIECEIVKEPVRMIVPKQ